MIKMPQYLLRASVPLLGGDISKTSFEKPKNEFYDQLNTASFKVVLGKTMMSKNGVGVLFPLKNKGWAQTVSYPHLKMSANRYPCPIQTCPRPQSQPSRELILWPKGKNREEFASDSDDVLTGKIIAIIIINK